MIKGYKMYDILMVYSIKRKKQDKRFWSGYKIIRDEKERSFDDKGKAKKFYQWLEKESLAGNVSDINIFLRLCPDNIESYFDEK